MSLVMFLSSKKVSDTLLVALGNFIWIFGGAGMYLFWVKDGTALQYIIPVMVSCSGFPFIASTNRSNFTKAVMSKPELENSQAMMQAVLSMAASVAGFVYVLESSSGGDNPSFLTRLCRLALRGLLPRMW